MWREAKSDMNVLMEALSCVCCCAMRWMLAMRSATAASLSAATASLSMLVVAGVTSAIWSIMPDMASLMLATISLVSTKWCEVGEALGAVKPVGVVVSFVGCAGGMMVVVVGIGVLPVRMREMVAADELSRLAISRVDSPARCSVMASAASRSRSAFFTLAFSSLDNFMAYGLKQNETLNLLIMLAVNVWCETLR